MLTKVGAFLGMSQSRRHASATPLEDAAQKAAKLIGSMRQSKRVKSRADLPPFRNTLSKDHGITGNDLSSVAVVDLGAREVIVLVSDSSVGQRIHMDLRNRILDTGYSITQESVADVALIAEINKAITKEDADNKASDVRPIVDEMIRDAITEKATDIHICCRENSGMVLYRIHSRIYQSRRFDVVTCEQVAGYMFTQMADARSRSTGSFALESKSMSCMFKATVEGTQYKLRYKYIRVADGWDVIIRILPVETPGHKNKTFSELGYEDSHIKQLELSVARSIGLIAITGPTGSGKSTTLKTMMEFDPKRLLKKRYSIEDPVEYKIFAVSQISIQRSDHEQENSNTDVIGVLRDILRADPNDVMVGETRDSTIAALVADFVLTGHKIYTTLHTASAIAASLRLHRLGLDRHVLADRQFIGALVFQRLLPVLCNHCKVPATEVLPVSKQMLLTNKFSLNIENIYCSLDAGCEHCRFRGITGSTVVAEIIVPDKVIRGHIATGQDEQAEMYWRQSRCSEFDSFDMTGKTAYEHALYKIAQGWIDPRDLEQEFEPLETYEVVELTV